MGRYVGYARVSTFEQKEGISLDQQKREIRDFVREHGGYLLNVLEEAETGGNNDRPVLNEAIAVCKEREATLLVTKVDRLARRHAYIETMAERHGIDISVIELEGMDPIMRTFMGVFAEMELNAIRERTADAMQAKKARGEAFHPENLWSKSRDNTDAGAKARSSKLRERREKMYAEISYVIKDLRREQGYAPSMADVAEELNRRRFLSPNGKPWKGASLRRNLHTWAEEWKDREFADFV